MRQGLKNFLVHNQLLLLIAVGGLGFLTLTNNWVLYHKPAVELGSFWMKLISGEAGKKISEIPDERKDNREEMAAEQNTGKATDTDQGEAYETPAAEKVSGGEAEAVPAPKTELVWGNVEDDYFDDALFIGDSRVVGLQDYGKMEEHATFYASTGLTIFRLLSAKIVPSEGQYKKISVEEALGQRQFGKIYLMVGINELDVGTVERFRETYGETVARIRELQPEAIIYIQSIMKVTEKRSAKGDYITNQGISDRNDAIKTLADGETIFYLDVNEAVCDESGGMNPDYTTDGVHLKVKYIPLWKDYLKSHAIITMQE